MKRDQEPTGPKVMYPCFLCGQQFQFGPHRYAGRKVTGWNIMICETCDKSNWDGIVLDQHPRLAKHLAERGIVPTLNARGWAPIPS